LTINLKQKVIDLKQQMGFPNDVSFQYFFPLPGSLAPWAIVWPKFYLNQLFYAITLGESVFSPGTYIAALTGLTPFLQHSQSAIWKK
jgi:hypothetical protein